MTKPTISEVELRKLVADGVTHREIAERIGRHVTMVSATCAVLGISTRPAAGSRQAIDEDGALVAFRAGLTVDQIAANQGVNRSTLVKHLQRAGLPTCARKLLRMEAEQRQAA